LEKEKEDADARVAQGQKRDLDGEGEERSGKKAKTGGDEDEEEMEMDEDDDGAYLLRGQLHRDRTDADSRRTCSGRIKLKADLHKSTSRVYRRNHGRSIRTVRSPLYHLDELNEKLY
jgi:hypothetical protein